MGRIGKIKVLSGTKTSLQQTVIVDALRSGIPVIMQDTGRTNCTDEIIDRHNRNLAEGLIDNEPPEAYFGVDPNDEIFNKPLNKL